MKLEGKVAVISGGGSGVGGAATITLAERGSNVLVGDIDEDGGHRTVNLVADKAGTVVFIRCDVTKELEAVFGNAVERFGRCVRIRQRITCTQGRFEFDLQSEAA
jgi:NAD(P)-dependent dehydrogenase (short-subunit alcohol dehydrogenase family)